MKFDVSDVVEQPARARPRRRRPTTSIPIDEDDILEPACVWPRRVPTGTTPPRFDPLDITLDATPVPIEED